MTQAQTGMTHSAMGIDSDFPASIENVEVFIAAIHGFLADKNLGSLGFDLELLAREALANAVVHGSRADPALTVHAELRLEPGRLVLHVRDQGPGWDWRNLSSRTPDPASESGRGLFIIGKYADSFTYNDQGNALTIIKHVATEAQDMETPKDSTVRMTLEPRVAAPDVPALRDVFRARIQDGGRQFELDCSRLESLDSMGIGLLVATHNSLVKQGGALKLIAIRKEIFQLLTLMRLNKHIAMTPAQGA